MNKLWLIVGPSGAGKTTLIQKLHEERLLTEVVSCTTRPQREGESASAYVFVTPERFKELAESGQLAEQITFGSHGYGLIRSHVDLVLEKGPAGIVCAPPGVQQLKAAYPEAARIIFLLPPSRFDLHARLKKRGMSEEEIEARHQDDIRIIEFAPEADYWIPPGTVAEIFDHAREIIRHG